MIARKIFFMVIVLALALAGCAAGEPGGEGTGAAVPTDPIGSVEENTPAPGAPLEAAGGAPGAAGTPQAVEAPFLATSIIGSEVAGQAGDYGAVEGIVLDASTGRGQYLVARNIGAEAQKDVLLPWNAFQLVLLAPDQVAAGSSYEPVVWLTVEDSMAAAAPEVDSAALSDAEERAEDWEAESRQYWTGKVPEMPVTGGDAAGGQNVIYLSQSVFDDIEYPVRNAEGDAVGQLEDMLFNPDGTLSFGVVEFTSLLDLGEAQVVVPWKLLEWSGEERVFTVNATDDQLRDAPRFDIATLPDMTIPGWNLDWQRYWEGSGSHLPNSTASAAGGQMRVSHLIGSSVTDVNDAVLGEVVDIILGQNGAVDYLVIQAEDKLRPVPWGGFEVGSAQESLLYLDDMQRYLDAPAFAALEQINAATPGWDDQIRGYWGLGAR